MSKNLEPDNPQDGFTQSQRDKLAQLRPVFERFHRDMPVLTNIVANVYREEGARHPYNHPINRLLQYLKSLQDACSQASYSLERIHFFCSEEEDAENISNIGFYVEYYIYDLLARVKTATDLLALLIKHIFELRVPNKRCSLDENKVYKDLEKAGVGGQLRTELARKLEEARNNWVKAFYELRNEVIHRTGLEGAVVSPPNPFSSYRFNIHLPIGKVPTGIFSSWDHSNPIGNLKPLADAGDPLSKFLIQIRSRSLSPIDRGIDAVKFSEEIWELLTALVEDIIKTCEPQISDYISAKKR